MKKLKKFEVAAMLARGVFKQKYVDGHWIDVYETRGGGTANGQD